VCLGPVSLVGYPVGHPRAPEKTNQGAAHHEVRSTQILTGVGESNST